MIGKLLEKPLPIDRDDLAQWLIEQQMVIADGRGYYITNFGAIAAARELEQFENVSRKRIRVIRYRGTNKVNTIDELPGHRPGGNLADGLVGAADRAEKKNREDRVEDRATRPALQ